VWVVTSQRFPAFEKRFRTMPEALDYWRTCTLYDDLYVFSEEIDVFYGDEAHDPYIQDEDC